MLFNFPQSIMNDKVLYIFARTIYIQLLLYIHDRGQLSITC